MKTALARVNKLFKWHNRTERWLKKRIPAARQYQLDLRSIFIFPSKFGWLFLVLCLCLFILGTNYQNNLMRMLCYFLVAVFLLNLFIAYLNFAKIQLQLGKCHNIFAEDQLKLPFWLNANQQDTQRPQGKLHFGFWRQNSTLCIDADQHSNPVSLAFSCQQRGPLTLPRVSVSSYYPLGLFRCWTYLDFVQDILVYPKPLPCELNLFASEQSGESASLSILQSGHDDFDTLKTYQPGEPLYHVAWKQLAKGQGMLTKQFSSSVNQAVWLKLLPCPPAELEKQLSHLCYQVIELGRRQQKYGLDLGKLTVPPDSSAQHQQQCLSALALFGKSTGAEHA